MSAALLARYAGRRVVVNLVGGSAIDGVFERYAGELLVLASATLHRDGVSPAALDGEVIIALGRVDFVQVPPTA